MDFFQYNNKLNPRKGRLLASEPYLADPNFERTIILLTEHNAEGSVGFVLNKPSDTQLSEIMEGFSDFDTKVNIGGPVQQDTLHFIHRIEGIENSITLSKGLYWGGNFDHITALIETNQLNPIDIKFFLGYSGWSPGQLDEELAANSWIVSDKITDELIFETPAADMWKKSLQFLGGRFSVYSNYPLDPTMN